MMKYILAIAIGFMALSFTGCVSSHNKGFYEGFYSGMKYANGHCNAGKGLDKLKAIFPKDCNAECRLKKFNDKLDRAYKKGRYSEAAEKASKETDKFFGLKLK